MRDSIPAGSVVIYQQGSCTVYRVPLEAVSPSSNVGPHDGHVEIWKVLTAGAHAGERDRHRTEYLLLQRLQRLHWPTVYDFRILRGGACAIVMDEARGVALSEMRLPTGFGLAHLRICHQILAALDMLHWTGHAHADLKPEHVFIDLMDPDAPRVTLIDLGLAISFGDRERSGTLRDMPPEILLENEPWSAASDHYLFGLVLYYLITGTHPRSDKDRWDVGWLEAVLPELPFDTPLGLTRLLRNLLGPVSERPTRAIQIWSALREMFPEYSEATERLLHESESDPTKLPPFPIVGRLQEIRRFTTEIDPVETASGATVVHCHIEGETGSGRRTLMGHLGGIAETRGWKRLDPREPDRLAYEAGETRARLEFHVESLPATSGLTTDVPVVEPEEAVRPPGSGSDARREVRFRVRVQPLAAAEMEALARTRLESPRLIERTAQICLGLPGLLETLLPTIPRLADFVSRDFPGAWNEFDYERLDPPARFVEFAAAIGASLPSTVRRLYCIVAIIDAKWDREPLAELVEAPPDAWMGLVAPTAYPGVFDPTLASPCFSSPLWRSAWLHALRDESRNLAEQILPSISPAASGDQLADACRVAIELELWEHANPLLERALRKLHEIEMYTRELDLLRYAIDRVPESKLRVTSARFEAVAEIIQLLTFDAGQAFPDRFAEGQVPAGLKKHLQKTLIAAALLGRRKCEHALRVLGSPTDFPDGPPSLEWVVLYFHCKEILGQPEPIDWLLGLESLPRFSKPRARAILCYTAALSPRLSQAQGVQLLEVLDSLVGARVYSDLGVFAGRMASFRAMTFFRGLDLDSALIEARRAEEILRNLEARTPHTLAIQRLAAISYERASLADAYAYGRLVVRQNLAAGLVSLPLSQMPNQVLCALDRGRFDLALMETESIRSLATHSSNGPARLRNAEALVASYAGLPELLPDQSDGDPIVDIVIALTHFISGDTSLGRVALERTKNRLAGEGRDDDVAELVLDWMQGEADLGNADQTLSLWVELDSLFEDLTPRSRLKLLVAQNSLALAGWIDAPTDLESLMFSTLEALRRADYGFLVWRACWHLAELNRRHGRATLESRWRDEARRHLFDLSRGLSRATWQSSFLQLPAPRRFLASA